MPSGRGRGRTTGQLSVFLFTRGLWMIVLEVTWIKFWWSPYKVDYETVGLAVQSAIEHISTDSDTARGDAVATNVFMRTPSGWRMVCHHASASPPVALPRETGPLH